MLTKKTINSILHLLELRRILKQGSAGSVVGYSIVPLRRIYLTEKNLHLVASETLIDFAKVSVKAVGCEKSSTVYLAAHLYRYWSYLSKKIRNKPGHEKGLRGDNSPTLLSLNWTKRSNNSLVMNCQLHGKTWEWQEVVITPLVTLYVFL